VASARHFIFQPLERNPDDLLNCRHCASEALCLEEECVEQYRRDTFWTPWSCSLDACIGGFMNRTRVMGAYNYVRRFEFWADEKSCELILLNSGSATVTGRRVARMPDGEPANGYVSYVAPTCVRYR